MEKLVAHYWYWRLESRSAERQPCQAQTTMREVDQSLHEAIHAYLTYAIAAYFHVGGSQIDFSVGQWAPARMV